MTALQEMKEKQDHLIKEQAKLLQTFKETDDENERLRIVHQLGVGRGGLPTRTWKPAFLRLVELAVKGLRFEKYLRDKDERLEAEARRHTLRPQ